LAGGVSLLLPVHGTAIARHAWHELPVTLAHALKLLDNRGHPCWQHQYHAQQELPLLTQLARVCCLSTGREFTCGLVWRTSAHSEQAGRCAQLCQIPAEIKAISGHELKQSNKGAAAATAATLQESCQHQLLRRICKCS